MTIFVMRRLSGSPFSASGNRRFFRDAAPPVRWFSGWFFGSGGESQDPQTGMDIALVIEHSITLFV
jgi:hypothetical protein